MTTLTVSLSERAAQAAFLRAGSQGLTVAELIRRIVEEALVEEGANPLEISAALSDDDVLAMADYQLSADEQDRLDQLLEANREGRLTTDQRAELDSLMKLVEEGMLRKSIGWAEAVRRNLRKSPI
jgi:hypothetical protein